ncbi:CHAT domain-containing protein [Sphingopyxis sp.]|uniref:CHAT domain-containing protein n=1 Tax=Sphingopyxis sp. TaxID=1908224 RepID=UPI003D0ABA36
MTIGSRSRWMTAWAFALALLFAAPALHAQTPPEDPAIAAKRDELMKTPFDQRPAVGEQLLKLIAKRFGEDSTEYAEQLRVHATDLNLAGRSVESQAALERVIAIFTRIHGPNGYATRFANRDYATTLAINGFKDQAVAPYRAFIVAATDEAYGCGRREKVAAGAIVHGCTNDEGELGGYLLGYAQLLIDLGRQDEALAAFDGVIARFEPRWAGCETDAWGTKCDRAVEKRRQFMASYARLLLTLDKRDRALAILRDASIPRLDALAACTADDCRADYWLLGDYRGYRGALKGGDAPAARALDTQWLPILGAEPIYARGKAEGAEYFDRAYREGFDEIAADFAKDAVAAGERDKAIALLEPLGLAGLVGALETSQDYQTRLAELDQRYRDIAYFDYDKRAAVRKEKVELERTRHGEKSVEYADALREVALEYKYTDDKAATEDYFRRALAAVRAGYSDDDYRTLNTLSYLTDWLAKQDRKADAIAILADVLAAPANDKSDVYADPIRSGLLASGLSAINDPHGQLNELKADLAQFRLETGGDVAAALTDARHAATGKRAYRRAFGFSQSDESTYAMAIDDSYLLNLGRRYDSYFLLFADALWAAGNHDDADKEEAFLALQEAQMGTTSRAVAKAAAERTLAQAGVSPLLAERRTIDAQITALQQEANAIVAPDPAERQRLGRLNIEAQQRLNFQRAGIIQKIAAASPGYFELVRPQPLSLADAQALLAPDEAVLMIVPTAFGTHSLLVTHDSLDWHRSDMKEAELGAHVRRLLWDVGASIDVTPEEDERWSAEGEGDLPYDRTTAWRLYQALVAPLEPQLANKRHLFTASSGSISSLPLGILVTAAPTGADGDPKVLRATSWFADKVALLQLPSLQSLQLLRAVGTRNRSAGGTAMIGFGDPLLDGTAQQRGGGTGRNRGTRSGAGLAIGAGLQSNGDGAALADPAALRKLARLPGTETELKAMQQLLGARQAKLFLAGAATETNMKRSKLNDLSVLFLATHGLVAGEASGVAEPGLVFTPPNSASTVDDGLLTASEIASLRLGARWVILSACNTAAGDGSQGAPGLSGLARSFFFAGAESLLASHWPVRDDVAAVLTVKLFELMRADPKLSRAEALQKAEKAIRDDERADPFIKSWSHPSAWAPFSLIGDGIN